MNSAWRIHLAAVTAVLLAAGCQGENGTVGDAGPTEGVRAGGQ